MVSPWVFWLALSFCGGLASPYFRKLLRISYESVICKNVPNGVTFKGETAEEGALHRQALRRSVAGFAIINAIIVGHGLALLVSEDGRARLAAAVEAMAPSPARLLSHACMAGLIIRGIVAETVDSPLIGQDNKAVICRRLGFLAYWTIETQTMAITILCLSAAGEAALALGLLPSHGVLPAVLVAAPYRFAIMTSVQCVMVTLLFTATMLGNDKWREKYVHAKEKEGLPAGWYQVVSHYTLPLAVVDLLVVRRPILLKSLGLGFGGNLLLAVGFSCCFAMLILFTYKLTGVVQYVVILPMMTPTKFPLVLLGIVILQCVAVGACWLAVEYTV